MKITAVLFDIGGVVVDADLESYAEVAAQLFAAEPADLRMAVQERVPRLELGQIDSDQFWKEVGEWLWSQGKGRLAEPTLCKGLWRRILAERCKVNPKVVDLCWQLNRRGLVVGALSNTILEHAEHLATMGVYQPFRPCLLSFQIGMRKPDKSIYQLAAKKAGKPIKDILLVDDNPDNVNGARLAGMQAHYFQSLSGLLGELTKMKLV